MDVIGYFLRIINFITDFSYSTFKNEKTMFNKYYLLFLSKIPIFLVLFTVSITQAEVLDASERQTIKALRNLDLEALMEVEVILDDTFNIFDSLVANRNTALATGKQKALALAPAVTTVITAMDIEATGASSLAELFETIPGVHVMFDRTVFRPLYLIRGISSIYNAEVLILVNGVPLNTYQSGNRGPLGFSLPMAMVQRIEVMRGPGSAVFGADAFAGVINIITKNAQNIENSEVGLRVGSFDTIDAWLLHSAEWQGFDIGIMMGALETKGHDGIIEADLQTSLDRINQTDFSYAPSPLRLGIDRYDVRLDVMRGHWQLRAAYQNRTNVEPGVGIGNNIDPVTFYQGDRSIIDLTYYNPYFSKYWDVSATLSYYVRDYTPIKHTYLMPPGVIAEEPIILDTSLNERQTRLSLSGFYTGFTNHQLRLGSGYHNSDINETTHLTNIGLNPFTQQPIDPGGGLVDVSDTSQVYLPEGSRQNWYFFLQDSWQFLPDWELTTGLRYDHYSDFGGTFNPRAALVWQSSPRLTSKLLYGEAFRSPTRSQLYVTNNPEGIGNPDLVPEKIKMLELAFNYQQSERLNWNWNIFTYDLEDKILEVVRSSDEEVMKRFENVGTQHGYGLELEARWKASKRFSVLGNYAWQTSKDQHHQPVPYTPRHQAYLRTDWMLAPAWYLNTQINWIAERPRSADDFRLAIGDYTHVDLTLHYKSRVYHDFDMKLGVRNLFDRQSWMPTIGPNNSGLIIIPNDLPLPKRHYFLEFRYRF